MNGVISVGTDERVHIPLHGPQRNNRNSSPRVKNRQSSTLLACTIGIRRAQGYEILPPPLAQRANHLRTRHNVDLEARDVSFHIGIVLSYNMILRSDSAN